jgi:hypothetical protein
MTAPIAESHDTVDAGADIFGLNAVAVISEHFLSGLIPLTAFVRAELLKSVVTL